MKRSLRNKEESISNERKWRELVARRHIRNIIKGSSLNRKGTIKEGMNVRIPGTRKNAIRKNLGKYNRLILSS